MTTFTISPSFGRDTVCLMVLSACAQGPTKFDLLQQDMTGYEAQCVEGDQNACQLYQLKQQEYLLALQEENMRQARAARTYCMFYGC